MCASLTLKNVTYKKIALLSKSGILSFRLTESCWTMTRDSMKFWELVVVQGTNKLEAQAVQVAAGEEMSPLLSSFMSLMGFQPQQLAQQSLYQPTL